MVSTVTCHALFSWKGFRCLCRVQNNFFNESPSARPWLRKKHQLPLVYFRDLFCQYEIEIWAFPHEETARGYMFRSSATLGKLIPDDPHAHSIICNIFAHGTSIGNPPCLVLSLSVAVETIVICCWDHPRQCVLCRCLVL